MNPEAMPPGSISGNAATTTSARGELTVGPPTQAQTKPYNPEPRRENIRALLAAGLVTAFLLLTGPLVAAVVLQTLDVTTAKDLATLTLTPLFGLTSTAVGFYYADGKN